MKTIRSHGWGALTCAALAFGFRGGCFDTPGNDPNVPDDVVQQPDGGGVVQCPSDLPECTMIPSYKNDIAPLIQRRCQPCHAAGGAASDRDLTTYAHIRRIQSTVLSQVYACLMPPADAGSDAMITAQERNDFLQWLVCNSPDN